MPQEIMKLLSNKRLRSIVVKTIQDVYSYAGTLHDNPSEDMEDIAEDDLWEEAWWRAEICGGIEKIDKAFDKYVSAKMQPPFTIYPDEISAEFYRLTCPGGIGCQELETIDFDNLYTAFVHKVNLDIMSYKSSRLFPMCLVYSDIDPFSDGLVKGIAAGLKGMEEANRLLEEAIATEDNSEKVLWQQKDIKVCLAYKSPFGELRSDKRAYLNVYVVGHMSPKALDSIQLSLPELLQTATRSLSLLNEEKQQKSNHGLPVLKEDVQYENMDTIRAYLDSFFAQARKSSKHKKEKDSFDRRIRNAVLLLVESDLQQNNAIGLALSVGAIEALLGERGSDISERISTNVGVLLEPEPGRRQEATEFVKDIYDKRSRALHGEQLEGKSDFRTQARHLAAAVLWAIITRRSILKRLGNAAESPQGLLRDLRKSRFKKGQQIGVEELNVREYWS